MVILASSFGTFVPAMIDPQLSKLLFEKARYYEQHWFVDHDPVSIPHRFSKKEDIEIGGFLAAIIAWGQRKTIINNANRLVAWMDDAPHDFILNHQDSDLEKMMGFVHRTFNSDDLLYFLFALKQLYIDHGGLEKALSTHPNDMQLNLAKFKEIFFQWEHLKRTEKHLSNPLKQSSAKRLNMFLRWMVRPATYGVDFGIWHTIQPSQLMMPLDVHTATVGRKLGLLKRKQNDWKAVVELTECLKNISPTDPVQFDFALFGIGAFEQA